jgi:hypothetical protein
MVLAECKGCLSLRPLINKLLLILCEKVLAIGDVTYHTNTIIVVMTLPANCIRIPL